MQYFGPKIRFLIWDRDFRQWTVCSPRRCGHFGTFGNIFRHFVSELWPFLWPPGQKMAIFADSHFTKGSTPNFGPNLTKLGRIVGITKKMIWFEWAAGPGPKYGETAVFAFC